MTPLPAIVFSNILFLNEPHTHCLCSESGKYTMLWGHRRGTSGDLRVRGQEWNKVWANRRKPSLFRPCEGEVRECIPELCWEEGTYAKAQGWENILPYHYPLLLPDPLPTLVELLFPSPLCVHTHMYTHTSRALTVWRSPLCFKGQRTIRGQDGHHVCCKTWRTSIQLFYAATDCLLGNRPYDTVKLQSCISTVPVLNVLTIQLRKQWQDGLMCYSQQVPLIMPDMNDLISSSKHPVCQVSVPFHK